VDCGTDTLDREVVKMKCDELESFTAESFGDGKCEVYEAVEVDAAIAELKEKLENVQASMYCNVVDAGMENRRLKRALWLARAELCRRLDVDRYLRKHINSWYNENCLTWAEACVAMEVKMCKAESKCRAKAEEYK
jgi:hypothetical protein